MDYCSQPELMPVAHALERMQSTVTPVTATEVVHLQAALDRVAAEPIYANLNIPSHDNSAMDGYAFAYASASTDTSMIVVGTALAGHPYNGSLGENECVRIMTGAIVPPQADTVIMQEQVVVEDNCIRLARVPELGENIRRAGDDIAHGTLVIDKGKRITPIDIGLLASLGVAQVTVFAPLRVAVLSTGDELKSAGQALKPGELYDSNRQTLLALLSRLDVTVIDCGLVADDPQKIYTAFESAANQADVVISSGGVSVGDADYTKNVLTSLGAINFWKVAMKPGKPFAFGALKKSTGNAWFFGLPGNPVSAVVTYHQLVLPVLRHLSGEQFSEELSLPVKTNHPLKKQPGRADYQRGVLQKIDGEICVSTTGNQSSGVLSSIARANCYLVLEQDRGSVAKGESVSVIPFNKFLL